MSVPRRVGPYRVVGRLGEGGMGIVHRAVAPSGEEVALKVVRAALVSPAMVQRFEREARVRIDHPNVVRLVDASVDEEGTPYIAFELLEGESLAERLARGRLTVREVVDLGAQAAAGLAAAHAAGVVHRDLKPSNVFVTNDGVVKLVDFGIAQITDATKLTQTGAVPGTVGYLSPEQAEGAPVDARSDLFSLGAVLYEALTGAPPFSEATPLATLVATLMARLVPVQERAPDVPDALAEAVERALARSPSARYRDATEMRDALLAARAIDEGADADARPSRPSTGSIRPGERRVVALLLAEGIRDAAHMAGVVEAEGGELLRLAGDRALGLFGGGTWEGDEVERAARAAEAVRDAVGSVAVASGWVAADRGRIQGAALAAAERCADAGVGGVALDTEAARVLREARTVVRVGDGVFELRREVSARSAGSDDLELVGRDAELAQLEAALGRALGDSRAVATLLVGPPGIGKTRLLEALERRARATSPTPRVVLVSATPRHRDAVLSVLSSILAQTLPGPRTVDAVAAALSELIAEPRDAHEHARVLVALAESRGASPEGVSDGVEDAPGTTGVDLVRFRDRARVAALDWLRGSTARAPLVLLIDDAQWIDDASLALLEELLDAAWDAPLFVGLSAREDLFDRTPTPFEGRDAVRVTPRGIGNADVAALGAAIVGRALAPSLVRAVADRTSGNPLFVIQTIRALVDDDLVDATDSTALPLPASIEAAVQARLDHLAADARELCRAVSVFARPFSAEEATAALGHDAEPLLGALLGRDLVLVRGRGAARRHQLRSALVAEVALRSLTEQRLNAIHERVARHLETSRDADVEERAEHWAKAGDPERAARDFVAAAHTAVRRGDTSTALRCSARALELGVREAERFALRALRVDALRFLGRGREQGAELDAMLEAADSEAERAQARSERAVWLARAGRTDEALADASLAVAAAAASGERAARVLARGRQFLVLAQAGRTEEAEEALADATAKVAGAEPALRALVVGWRAHHLATKGDIGARLDAFIELTELYDELGDLRRAAGARANLADAYNRVGAYAEALEALEDALNDCRRVGHRTMEGYTCLNIGYAKTLLGRASEALEALDEARVIAREMNEARLDALVALYGSRALRAVGRVEEARDAARDAAAKAADASMRDVHALAEAERAFGALEAADVDAALDASERALDALDALGQVEEDEATIFLARVRALEAAGRRDDAARVAIRARERIDRTAQRIADDELRARYLEAVPAHAALVEGGGGGGGGGGGVL